MNEAPTGAKPLPMLPRDNVTELTLHTVETDNDKAARHRTAIVESLKPVLDSLTAAHKDGFQCQFNIGFDLIGRAHINVLKLVKEYDIK